MDYKDGDIYQESNDDRTLVLSSWTRRDGLWFKDVGKQYTGDDLMERTMQTHMKNMHAKRILRDGVVIQEIS